MSFCKNSGKICISNPVLSPSLLELKTLKENGKIDLMEIEEKEYFSDFNWMPFRLTPNFVEFIGLIGLHGLFAGVMTSCSMAIIKNQEYIKDFLEISIRDHLFE